MSKQGVRWRNNPSGFGMTADKIVLGGYMIGNIAYVVSHTKPRLFWTAGVSNSRIRLWRWRLSDRAASHTSVLLSTVQQIIR